MNKIQLDIFIYLKDHCSKNITCVCVWVCVCVDRENPSNEAVKCNVLL